MEKFDKETVKKLMENLVNVDNSMRRSFREVYRSLSNAKDIDGVMIAKKVLLLNLLDHFPIQGFHCYFCLYNICSDCSYKRAHRKCGVASSENTSTWSKIIMKTRELREIIEKEYWTGEELKEEVASNEKKR